MPDELEEQVSAVGALSEPARRVLYLYVAAQPEPVSREQAATALDVPLHSAKFHLDRLVDEGLLEVEFRRLTGRQGPGAGRPAKLYRRSSRQLSVTLPARHYELAGDLLASAIDSALREGTPVMEAVRTAAHAAGLRFGRGVDEDGDDDLGRSATVLGRYGYEPRTSEHEICLANCPFDRLAAEHTELVCGMNLALIDGVLEGLDAETLTAVLEPEPGLCCVKVRGPVAPQGA